MRVLLVDPSSRGGIAAYTRLVSDALVQASACVQVLGSSALAPDEGPAPVIRALPADRWGKPAGAGPTFYARRAKTWAQSAFEVERQVRRVRPDVVHFQAGLNRRWDARLIRRIARRAPVVWTAHNALPFERTEQDGEWYRAIYRAVDAVIVHNEPTANLVRDLSGVDPVVIEHAVPPRLVDAGRAEARRHLDLPLDERVVAALGFIRPYKGYDLLADVWERLGDDAPVLLVMGELLAESERPVVERLRQHRRVALRIGYVDAAELELAATAADALLLAHREASDSGLLHLARAVSVPVIASDTPSLAAGVKATESGRVIPRDVDAWADAVTGPLPDPPPPAPSPRAVGLKHVDLYRRVVESRAAPLRPFRLAVYLDAYELGGAERVLGDLLAALDPAVDVTVLGTHAEVVGWVADHRPRSRRIVVPPVRDKWDVGAIRAHLDALRRIRPEIFHANLRNPWSCQYGLAAALATPGTKVMATEHALTPSDSLLQRLSKRVTSRSLAAHVAVGVASARDLENLVGLPRCSVQTIHNGIAFEPVSAERPTFAGTTVLGLGRLTAQKGFDYLLTSLVDLDGVRALIAGDGPERTALGELAAELGVTDRVRFLDWVDDPSELLRSADALVLPSRYESFPLVILEAMQAGLPVVSTDVGSVREALVDGETGVVVPVGDVDALTAAIRHVLDPAIGAEMGRRAAIAAERFTREGMAREYELVYRRLLA